MYKVRISAKARRQIKNLSMIHQMGILEVLQELRDDPHFGKPLTRELTGRLSIRIGKYRIVYKISEMDKSVDILTAGHRSMVYYQ